MAPGVHRDARPSPRVAVKDGLSLEPKGPKMMFGTLNSQYASQPTGFDSRDASPSLRMFARLMGMGILSGDIGGACP